jgi:predicted enzyme related to lactoylglutathione lyase
MPERSSYAPGTPCWVDYSSPDLDASIAFYGGLLGWEVPETENSAQTGGYRQALKGGLPVAGMMPKMEAGTPTAWNSYVSVSDADATAAAVQAAGGNVIAEPMDVLDLGRMAIFTDTGGAFFGVWQPNTFIGAQLVNEPGGVAWTELNTRDVEGAKQFYGSVFADWVFEDMSNEAGDAYTMIMLGERPAGGIFDLGSKAEIPAEVPPHWQVYFGVEDADAAVAKTKEAGGMAMMEPTDIPFGRIAILGDPHGASFAVIALSEMAQENA